MRRDEHMVVSCKKCRVWYDMDFEEAIDDEHDNCYSEDWDIDLIPCGIFSECDGCFYSPPPAPPGYWADLLAEKPRK